MEQMTTDAKMEVFDKFMHVQRMMRFLRHRARADRGPAADPTRGQGRVLALLKIHDGLATRDIANVCGIRVSSLNETLARMEREGLVERRASQEDGRVQQVFLTAEGAALAPSEGRMPGRVFADFSDEELEQLGGYLDRMATALEAELGEDGREMMEETRRRRHELGFDGEPGFGPEFGGRHGHGGPHRHGHGCHRGEGPRGPHHEGGPRW
ncbi:MAG: MarR family transcriptional regulator [Atopobiaceae bacterium]|nr:MarR family transcriptional regulator [Atopobiaceae bacterium]